MLPLPDVRLTVPVVRSIPELPLVISPEPLAVILMIPDAPVETAAFRATFVLPVSVANVIVPLPLRDRALEMVSALPDVTDTVPDEPLMVPSVTIPEALIVRFFVPSVIVCPDDVNVPPLLNCKL